MRTAIDFNKDWQFTKPGEDRVPVTLPHTWNALDGQDGGGDYWRGECVYEKTFAAPVRKAGEEVYLEFDGVSSSAKATLNGHFIGEHHGLHIAPACGSSPFGCAGRAFLQSLFRLVWRKAGGQRPLV